jgi:hypothetical protein
MPYRPMHDVLNRRSKGTIPSTTTRRSPKP